MAECATLDPDHWREMPYEPYGGPRKKVGGVTLATNIEHTQILLGHNEMVYNPRIPRRIALVCGQPAAVGGENIIARNADITKVVSAEIQDFVRAHGGIKYKRTYPDRNQAEDGKGR